MNEVIAIALKCVGIIAVALVTYVVVPAIRDWRATKLTTAQQEQLSFWVDIGVMWAKQWLQTSTGEEKKQKVMEFVAAKVAELDLPYTEEDIDKAIEAVYGTIKDTIAALQGE